MNFDGFEVVSNRLLLRPVNEADVDALYNIYADIEIMQFWSEAPLVSIDQMTEKIQQALVAQTEGTALMVAVVLRETNTTIGHISLFNIHEASARAEVGYLLHKDHWQQGYMSEALHAFIVAGFNTLGLRRLEADIDPDNAASTGLIRRMGFVQEGLFKSRWVVAGQITDSAMYGLLKDDFIS